MIMYHVVTKKDCQSHVRYLLDFSSTRSNRTIENPQPIAALTDLEEHINLICIQEPMQFIALHQNVYGVWAYSPQAQCKTWIPDATTNEYILSEKQSDEMYINFNNWKARISKI